MSVIQKFKEFRPSSWAIDNKTSIYILSAIITLAGIMSYMSLPKEQFPEVVFPQIYVSTIYPGTSPENMENLVTKQIEKQVKSIAGVKKVTSNSMQDFSNIIVEFNTDVEIPIAKQKVKDAVDKARNDLPTDLPKDPQVMEIDVSQIPIMAVNIAGDYSLDKLKEYADNVKDRIEGFKEITRVDMVGALEREVQINIDQYKMTAAGITFMDISNAIAYENMTISGGLVEVDGMRRNLNVSGQFTNVEQIRNLIIRAQSGSTVYLRDIAEVVDGHKEQESFARLENKNVITLNVIKRSGENLIDASEKIEALVKEMKASELPENIKITITGDQSDQTKVTLHDLINTIIIGFVLVTLILMFFMGTTNAIFVGLSVPLSMCVAFMIMPGIGFTLNMIVLFAFLLALGIVVDDAIVVIENTHRIYHDEHIDIVTAAKKAAGEVFLPVFSGTMTTLAPFIPLAFWQGVIGKFMFYLPITLIVTLTASLVVAYIINPVFAVDFMEKEGEAQPDARKTRKRMMITTVIFGALALVFHLSGSHGLGNLMIFFYLFHLLNKYVLKGIIEKFQTKTWPTVQEAYVRLLKWNLKGRRPIWVLLSTVALFFFSIILTGIVKPDVVFFPSSDPNFVYTYIKLPIGTDQKVTDSVTRLVEDKIYKIVGKNNPIVESVIANVAVGAGDPSQPSLNAESNKGKVAVAFVEFAKRNGESTTKYLDKIRESVKGMPGVEITVEKEQNGPPTGKPINIEIAGDDFSELTQVSASVKRFIQESGIQGIEELKSNLELNKPEIQIVIDRERANREGISTAQVGMEIRNAVFGKEASKFRDAKDDYPIQMRYNINQRNDVDRLINHIISFRDMNMGGRIRNIPLSAVARIEYTNTFGGIARKNQKRLATLSSNVLTGFTPNEVVAQIEKALKSYPTPEGVTIKMTGEQEEQAETGAFLGNAMLVSLGLIFLILVTQFNSLSKPVIILSEIFFSIIGVLLGFCIFGMSISIIMTGIGIVALAGIVVRNGILLVEFTEVLEHRGMDTYTAIVEAGRTRMTPVLLTASATILGLVPLAVGLNIDFASLFSEFDPKIFFGGDSVAFWGPLSWTMIFGLGFATFLTLILVPVMIWLNHRAGLKLKRLKARLFD